MEKFNEIGYFLEPESTKIFNTLAEVKRWADDTFGEYDLVVYDCDVHGQTNRHSDGYIFRNIV